MSARSRAGAAAQRAGSSFEADLLDAHRPTHVHLQRTSPPWHYAMIKGVLTAIVDEEGVPDFHGAVDGRLVAFDAKSTKDTRWKLAMVKKEQAAHLAEAVKRRCIAGILVRFDGMMETYWLPWPALEPIYDAWRADSALGLTKRGDASLTAADCGRIGRRVVCLRWWLEVAP